MADDKTETAKPRSKIKALSVRTPAKSFRRAGFEFSQEPTDIPLDSLTEEQIEALKTEPLLLVQEVTLG
jgi:hypothetical protein